MVAADLPSTILPAYKTFRKAQQRSRTVGWVIEVLIAFFIRYVT